MATGVFWLSSGCFLLDVLHYQGSREKQGISAVVPPSHSQWHLVSILQRSHLWFNFWRSKAAVIWEDLSVPSATQISFTTPALTGKCQWLTRTGLGRLSKELDWNHADPVGQLPGGGLEASVRSGAETSIWNGPNGATCRGWVREASLQRFKAPSPPKRDKKKEWRRERKTEGVGERN